MPYRRIFLTKMLKQNALERIFSVQGFYEFRLQSEVFVGVRNARARFDCIGSGSGNAGTIVVAEMVMQ